MFKKLALVFFISGCLSGCAMKYQTVTPELRSQMLSDLKSGSFTLNCDINCAFSWISNLDKLSLMYRSNQWENLAQTVMQIGYGNDLAYYFLGACAENMGYFDAAMKFYQFSWALYEDNMESHHCRDSGEGCGGLDIAQLLPIRMQATGQRQAMSAPLTPQELAEFHSMLYVKHAGILCSWPISKIVQPEMTKYLDYYKQRMEPNKFAEEDAAVESTINKRGAKKFCADKKEKSKFDEIVAATAPFLQAHPQPVVQMPASGGYEEDVPETVAVDYVYYEGFWWGPVWFPGGYYDPFWRFYGPHPGPRFVPHPGFRPGGPHGGPHPGGPHPGGPRPGGHGGPVARPGSQPAHGAPAKSAPAHSAPSHSAPPRK